MNKTFRKRPSLTPKSRSKLKKHKNRPKRSSISSHSPRSISTKSPRRDQAPLLSPIHTPSKQSFHTTPRHAKSILTSPHSSSTLPSRPPSTHPNATSKRSMWFFPDDSFKSRVQRAVVSLFNLAPPPPSVNVEEFALMSKMFQVIVDCRSEEQRQEGKIPKSVHVPLDTMLESNRENLSIQFSKLTVLVYDQDGRTVDQAATFLRDCGAESWSLEGGAESFKDFVTHTRNGTYTRRVTLEEARQHIYAQARAGAKLPRPYDANRALEHFDTRLDEIDPEESESGEKDKAIKSQPNQHPQTTQSAQSAVKKQQVDV